MVGLKDVLYFGQQQGGGEEESGADVAVDFYSGDFAADFLFFTGQRRFLPKIEANVWVLQIGIFDGDHPLNMVFADLGIMLGIINHELKHHLNRHIHLDNDLFNQTNPTLQ